SLNKTMKIFDRGLEFTIHEDTNRIMVRVVDRSDHNNEEVIREIPPEKILDMIAAFMDMIGLLVDQRA
ncbi:MAG: flagellar protein FlaG, partial [Firmicutes bacterium]|nr:flagellar protein FlaG [Bacillota bacterium]